MREAAEDEEAAAAEAATPDGLFADVKFTFLIKESAAEKGKAKLRCTLCPLAVHKNAQSVSAKLALVLLLLLSTEGGHHAECLCVFMKRTVCVCVVHLTLRVVGTIKQNRERARVSVLVSN